MNTRILTISGLIVGVVILLAVNIIGNSVFQSARLDLTQNKLFTLSDGTRNILSDLDEPVTLRLFLSRAAVTRLPGINSYANRVREMLQEYERAAHGNIDLQIIDPEPFSEQEDRAVGYGLQGVPLDDLNTVLYFGLVGTSSTDDEQVIPFFAVDREEFLEYDLTKLVHQLANPKLPVVGLISSLPIAGGMNPNAMSMQGMQGMQPPWTIVEQMRQLFDVRSIGLQETSIPDDVDVLMLVHPKELNNQLLYAIDQFTLGGGRALVFVDPYAETDQAGGALGMGGNNASNLDVLFKQWGVDLPTANVVGDLQTAARVQTTSDSRAVVIEYPVWMQVQPGQINSDDIVTADIGDLMFASAGQLIANNEAGTQITPLVQTTPNAAEVNKTNLGFGGDPQKILREYQSGGTALNLAVRVTGQIKTAFPDGAPAAQAPTDETDSEESEEEKIQTQDAEHLTESKEGVNLIVVADTDFLQDRFWVQVQNFLGSRMAIPTAGNGSFVINALDNLVGSNDLISVRSRGSYSRPFTLVQAIRQDAELRFRQTEQRLLDELTATEQKLVELDQQKGGNENLILSVEQQQEIERFREEKVRIRKDLRNVRHELQKDIERVASVTKFANIGLMPLIIGIGAMLFGMFKLGRRKNSQRGFVTMRGKSLIVLAIVAIVLVAAAMLSRERPETATPENDMLLPELMDNVNSISTIRLQTADAAFSVQKSGAGWSIDQQDGYPADTEIVRSLLLGMARTKRLEAKTKNPDLYEKLQLEDVEEEGSQSVLVSLLDDKNDSFADIVFGKSQAAKADPAQREYYVRVGDDPQSWLVQSDFDLVKDASQWLLQEVLAVDESRIRSAEVTHEDGTTVKVQRDSSEETNFVLSNIPEGRKLKYEFAVNDIANAFANLNLEAVVKVGEIDFTNAKKAKMRSFDGLQITLEAAEKDGSTYARLQAEFDPESVDKNDSEAGTEIKQDTGSDTESASVVEEQPSPALKSADEIQQEVATLNTRWTGWAYRLPDFELNNIFKPMDELLEEAEEEETEEQTSEDDVEIQN